MVKNWLFSGSYNGSVFGGERGTVYKLIGYSSKVTSLVYSPSTSRLVSMAEDSSMVVVLDIDNHRVETPKLNIDTCLITSDRGTCVLPTRPRINFLR